MINFILYEDDECSIKNYSSIINEFMMDKSDSYQIVSFKKYDKDTLKQIKMIDTKKIFILDIQVPGKSGIELAREIRLDGDWISPIIICSGYKEYRTTGFTSRILTLDFIIKNKNICNAIKSDIKLAYRIISTHNSYNFKYCGEYYQIPYDSILFIEKNLNDNYAILHTKRNRYIVKDTISNINSTLKDERFFQSHRSCIINLENVASIDFPNNTVHFENISTDLLSRDAKRKLKNILNV